MPRFESAISVGIFVSSRLAGPRKTAASDGFPLSVSSRISPPSSSSRPSWRCKILYKTVPNSSLFKAADNRYSPV